jgi:ATP-dependent Clp protease adapter protein ClpS
MKVVFMGVTFLQLLCISCAFYFSFPSNCISMRRTHTITAQRLGLISGSTVVTPSKPKIDTPGKVLVPQGTPEINGIFRPIYEFEENIDESSWLVVLFNDPFNKRQFVQQALMEVFNWDESRANGVMMQAHTNGMAVCGEFYKELAEGYAKQLQDKGLDAEAVVDDKKGSGGSAEP